MLGACAEKNRAREATKKLSDTEKQAPKAAAAEPDAEGSESEKVDDADDECILDSDENLGSGPECPDLE